MAYCRHPSHLLTNSIMWTPLFFAHVLVLGIATLFNFAFFAYLLTQQHRTTGSRAILFASTCITIYVALAAVFLFVPAPAVINSIPFFGVLVFTSFLLVALLAPNKPWTYLHTGLLVLGTIIAVLTGTPGIVYETITPTPYGYAELTFAPTAYILNIYFLGILIGTSITYYRRITSARTPATRFLYWTLAISFLIYLLSVSVTTFILPYFGIAHFALLVLVLTTSIIIGTFAILYTQKFKKNNLII